MNNNNKKETNVHFKPSAEVEIIWVEELKFYFSWTLQYIQFFGSNFCFQYCVKTYSIKEIQMMCRPFLNKTNAIALTVIYMFPHSEKKPDFFRCEHRTLHQDQQFCWWAWPGGWDTVDPNNSHLTVSQLNCALVDLDKGSQFRWEELKCGADRAISDICVKLFTLKLVYAVLSASKSSCWPKEKFTWLWDIVFS